MHHCWKCKNLNQNVIGETSNHKKLQIKDTDKSGEIKGTTYARVVSGK